MAAILGIFMKRISNSGHQVPAPGVTRELGRCGPIPFFRDQCATRIQRSAGAGLRRRDAQGDG